MRISELATRTGVAIHTLRFYEREGLLDDRFFERGDNRYRDYTEAAVERVGMIRQGQAAGYTLNEVRDLLAAWDAGDLTAEVKLGYLAAKVEEISSRIAELERLRAYLCSKIARMQAEAQPVE